MTLFLAKASALKSPPPHAAFWKPRESKSSGKRSTRALPGILAEQGTLLNTSAIESVRRNRVALKGPMATAVAGGAPSVNVALRKTLDLYANLRPGKKSARRQIAL